MIIVSILPLSPNSYTYRPGINKTIMMINAYYKEFAKKNGFIFLDQWNEFYDITNDCMKNKYDRGDGIHWNYLGQAVFIENVKNVIN